jgi:hypothetical protein
MNLNVLHCHLALWHLPISDDEMYFYNDYRACHGLMSIGSG